MRKILLKKQDDLTTKDLQKLADLPLSITKLYFDQGNDFNKAKAEIIKRKNKVASMIYKKCIDKNKILIKKLENKVMLKINQTKKGGHNGKRS